MTVIGHDAQWRELMEAASGSRPHHAWLLAGPRGIGKGSFARRAALALLAGSNMAPEEDSQTVHLVNAGSHPDYACLTRAEKESGELARNITVDQVRALHRLLESAPSLARRRVIVIDAADDMEREGANALLKSLEEPPTDTLFLLVTHAPSRLLPTIRSRCRTLRFAPLSDDEVRAVLAREVPDASPDEREVLVRESRGAPGQGVALAGLGLAAQRAALLAIRASGDPDNSLRLALANSLAQRSGKDRYAAFLETAPGFFAELARHVPAHANARVILAWEEARDLAVRALRLSLDPASTVFRIGTMVADLAAIEMEGETDIADEQPALF